MIEWKELRLCYYSNSKEVIVGHQRYVRAQYYYSGELVELFFANIPPWLAKVGRVWIEEVGMEARMVNEDNIIRGEN